LRFLQGFLKNFMAWVRGVPACRGGSLSAKGRCPAGFSRAWAGSPKARGADPERPIRMTRKQMWKTTSASLALVGMMANTAAFAREPKLTLATSTASLGEQYAHNPKSETQLGTKAKIQLLRQKIKYVFVIFQENRSFDSYFGTYPGANGLFSTFPGADPADPAALPANQTPSFTQNIRNTDGSYSQITPFLSPRTIVDVNGSTVQMYPESTYSVDHSHTGYIADLHPQDANISVLLNDGYALDQEGLEYLSASSSTANGNVVVTGSTWPPANVQPTSYPSLTAKQKAENALAHHDCDTIPFLWHYADVGTLFDNLHQTIIGPSTPNAIAMIASQSGATQWALHPSTTGLHTTAYTVPNETDSAPFAGGNTDSWAGKPPYGPDEASFNTCAVANSGAQAGTYNNLSCPAPLANDPAYASYTSASVVALDGTEKSFANPQLTLTFASLPLSFMGSQIRSITAQDVYPGSDLVDVQHDIFQIGKKNPFVNWGWYQLGFGPEPFDANSPNPKAVDGFPAATPHSSYIVHHNGPQYFGYLGDNPAEVANMHGLSQFYSDVSNSALSASGGVYYIRGGYYNDDGLSAADPSPAAQTVFSGNDDHGSYSDSQISEAMVADTVNAIASSPYWSQSAIIITYDESDGFYDHAPEAIRNWGPDGLPMSGGPRIPTIVLSPYGAAHTVSHVMSEHGSVVQFIDDVFGLERLRYLPDEKRARALGATEFTSPDGSPQTELGPNDGKGVGEMLEAFDNDRLLGNIALVPASAVTIPTQTVLSLPHYGGAGCSALAITPTDYPNGVSAGAEIDPPPQDFNPRPTVAPGIPYLEETILGGNITNPWTP
jgi:phospholipase C